MISAKKGDWVQVENIVLPAGHRAPQVPEDTQKCDLKMWVKGEALQDAKEDEELEVKTTTGRIVKGRLVEVNSRYVHDYGEFQPELLKIEHQLKEILFGGEK
ncbi:2-amino-4-oxopentanoate thiolase subunit OrtA [Anaerotignum sp.]|uniref:2-amino-4-oxopentanoate thiolase subunit OrtA n=1 Tax=Anaerotignum sp. TaxID=2039241 RepID=UPI002ED2900E